MHSYTEPDLQWPRLTVQGAVSLYLRRHFLMDLKKSQAAVRRSFHSANATSSNAFKRLIRKIICWSWKQMVPRSPPAGRRVNLWQVSSPVHLRSVSVTLLTVPAARWEDTLHRTAVTSLLMNTEEPRTSRRPQNGWEDSSGRSDHSPAGCRLKWSGTWLLVWEWRAECHSAQAVIALMFEIHSMNPNISLRAREWVAVYGRSDRQGLIWVKRML